MFTLKTCTHFERSVIEVTLKRSALVALERLKLKMFILDQSCRNISLTKLIKIVKIMNLKSIDISSRYHL